jgi:hypothetical protein
MGGDLCHQAGQIRPSPYVQLPDTVKLPPSNMPNPHTSICPGALLEELNVKRDRGPDEPFFNPPMNSQNITLAQETIYQTQPADAQDHIFFIMAHDMTLIGVIDLFPKKANNWKEKHWKETTFWSFLDYLKASVISRCKFRGYSGKHKVGY